MKYRVIAGVLLFATLISALTIQAASSGTLINSQFAWCSTVSAQNQTMTIDVQKNS